MAEDEFETDKGVKDDYDGTITEAQFVVGQNGRTNLVLKKLADDGSEVEDFYAIGPDWASFDGGDTIEHASKSKIREDSQLATLVRKAMESGAEEIVRARSKANGGKGQRTAKLWPGLVFHWMVDAKPYNFKDEAGEEVKGTSYKSYPSAFLGESDNPVAPTSTGSSTAGDNGEVKEVSADTMKELTEAANRDGMTYEAWVDIALQNDEARSTILSEISDRGFFDKLRG